MSTHLALVRAEIKSWERDFASRHGRDPSVQDIRDQPSIAGKYKLYKKLSKAAAATSQTPPRTNSCLSTPKSRPAESVPPLPGFNPFSPTKKSVKHNHPLRPSTSRLLPISLPTNPFATPTKNKPNPCPRTPTPSPDLFFQPPIANTSSSHGHPVSTTAVSRARKRLRGEPVSPSPNKPKRQRIPARASPPFLDRDSSNSEHETEQELPQCDLISSFVADSPIKAPAGGKSFKLLFDDAVPALSTARKPAAPSAVRLDHSVMTSLKLYHDPRSKDVSQGLQHRADHIQTKLSPQIFPVKSRQSAPSHNSTLKPVVFQVSQPRTSVKRPLDGSNSILLQSQYPLIPPSPPPKDSINRDAGKGKGKVTAGRKKLRVEDEESDERVDSSDDIAIKIATVKLDRSKHRHSDDFEWDPLLHARTRNHDLSATEQIDANHHASGTFTVDLPDEFRRMLAISPPRSQNNTEERVVRGLLYGDRVGHYDPFRGGHIWDAGETDEGALGDAEVEDDWEGEPVPWEVGEL